MSVLGVRCSNSDFAYAILDGTIAKPVFLDCNQCAFPINYHRPQLLTWLVQEIDGIIKRHHPDVVVVKSHEGMTKGGAYEERVEAEGAVAIAAGNNGIRSFYKKRRSSLAKDLGLKGRARYLATLNTSVIPSFSSSSPKQQEALLCAWSGLH